MLCVLGCRSWGRSWARPGLLSSVPAFRVSWGFPVLAARAGASRGPGRSWGRFRRPAFRRGICCGRSVAAGAVPGLLAELWPVPWPLGLLASCVPCWAVSRFLSRCCRSGADLGPLLLVVDFLHMLFHWAGRVMRHKRGRVCRIRFRRDLAGGARAGKSGFSGLYSPFQFFPGYFTPLENFPT